jgi:hypothetical protein
VSPTWLTRIVSRQSLISAICGARDSRNQTEVALARSDGSQSTHLIDCEPRDAPCANDQLAERGCHRHNYSLVETGGHIFDGRGERPLGDLGSHESSTNRDTDTESRDQLFPQKQTHDMDQIANDPVQDSLFAPDCSAEHGCRGYSLVSWRAFRCKRDNHKIRRTGYDNSTLPWRDDGRNAHRPRARTTRSTDRPELEGICQRSQEGI